MSIDPNKIAFTSLYATPTIVERGEYIHTIEGTFTTGFPLLTEDLGEYDRNKYFVLMWASPDPTNSSQAYSKLPLQFSNAQYSNSGTKTGKTIMSYRIGSNNQLQLVISHAQESGLPGSWPVVGGPYVYRIVYFVLLMEEIA